MTIVEATALGIVQGLTEFFPVSSTGHLVIVEHLFGIEQNLSFDVFVHAATLVAVILFFWREIISFKPKTVAALIIGSIPVGIVGVFFKDAIETMFTVRFIGVEMLVNAAICFTIDRIIEKRKQKEEKLTSDINEVSFKQAFITGLFQTLGLSPGVTRSGSTVLGGLVQKLDRLTAFKFSFLLSLPAIAGASLLQFADVYQEGFVGIEPISYAAGATAALISGLLSLYLFKLMIEKARMEIFGWYCFVVGVAVLLFL